MPPTSTADIRTAYLSFFQSKGHALISGASLVPENDPTVLFTTAGMHPLVPYLLGEHHPAGRRLANVQRCVRTQDIDEVGDASHLTCFEMLGNWSLGDYFKEEAITMSFQFLTQILGIPVKTLAVSCFEGDADAPKDEESAAVWRKLGIPGERIAFLPKAKNWWGPAGKSGPCGPDTEMFTWVGTGEPTGNPKTHEDDWLEIWNDVFLQYNKRDDGTFGRLKQQNVDTGMGLDRVAVVLQGVQSVYDTDAMRPILQKVQSVSDRLAGRQGLRDMRIVVDHLKAATFILADGVAPSNVDRGYVLRRLIRRAIRSARLLGAIQAEGFCVGIAEAVIGQYGGFYAHLLAAKPTIFDALNREESTFLRTLQDGNRHFQRVVAGLQKRRDSATSLPLQGERPSEGGVREGEQGLTLRDGSKRIAGLEAFHLYDTYGFPIELTKEMAKEQGLTVDEEGFRRAFSLHQEKSRAGAERRFSGGLADHSAETTKLHTATHLLNAALRRVLGDHVWQKGSNITAERLRFDFSHPDKMTKEQIGAVEKLMNEAIKADVPITYRLMTVGEAKAAGAIGVFDAKYGEKVKVYSMGSFSKEICGGPHVARTGMLGSFKIQKEESSSAGVRRIKAVVSGGPTEIAVATEE